MSTLLTNHLKFCSETDPNYLPLFAQWSFDEQLASKALQNINIWFPHYSRHDSSHSRQILIHIERLLGEENISKLSATDTWLLLEASYFHDIGMIVPFHHINKDFEGLEFRSHLLKRRTTTKGDEKKVIEALLAMEKGKPENHFLSIGFSPLYSIKLLREIISDFYRVKHPDRAESIINNPSDLGINSPRTELIPARLFSILGKICSHHGKSFEDVMELPQQQVGIGRDDCHPRYVACLLRLGDLLDLDDNRFCPVMLKMAGPVPESTKAHVDKHVAIRRYRADRERIEIEAECESYEGYVVTNQWFGWLRKEVQQQMGRWFEIVPNRDFGLLPSVGDLKVQLKDWKVYSENERPHFNIDKEKIFDLLQGAGLYDRKEQAIRELLQNAVDATLIRAWMEHREGRKNSFGKPISLFDEPRAEHVTKILQKYIIQININKEKEDEENNYWRIEICDQGTGISETDLHFMMQIGGSIRNHNRRNLIDTMPIWMRPSGIYGIGLQSVFLLTDAVEIETSSIETGVALYLKLTNPDGDEKGNIYVRESKKWDVSNYGSRLSFIYKKEKGLVQRNWFDRNSYSNLKLADHDFQLNDSKDFEILTICDEVRKFFELSTISGELNCKEMAIEGHLLKEEAPSEWRYCPDSQLEISNIGTHSGFQIFYRGQSVDTARINDFISGWVNLLDERADTLLTINRNKIRDSSYENMKNRIQNAIQFFFQTSEGESCFSKMDENNKALVCAEYELNKWALPTYFPVEYWQKANLITIKGEKIQIDQLLNYESFIFIQDEYNTSKIKEPDNKSELLLILSNGSNDTLFELVSAFLVKHSFTIYHEKLNAYNQIGNEVVRFCKQSNASVSPEVLSEYCKSSWRRLFRATIPIPSSDFSVLRLKDRTFFDPDFDLDLINPRMLFPLLDINKKMSVGNLTKLSKLVFDNRYDQKVTLEEIEEAYKKFIHWIDFEIMKDDPEWKERRGDEYGKY